MKHTLTKSLIATAILASSTAANAAVEIYNNDGTTFSADGLIIAEISFASSTLIQVLMLQMPPAMSQVVINLE